jgi:broad specificity phosphatase PhoE
VSYDLYMLTPEPGVDPMDQVERMEGTGPRAPDPEGEARARRLAEALRAADARYEQSDVQAEGTTAIGLSAEDGMEITLWPDHASFNFPYWESLDAARLAADIEQAAKVIAGETGWELYDPQLEKFMDPVRDADEFAAAFGVGAGHVQRVASHPAARPWWRRLLGE